MSKTKKLTDIPIDVFRIIVGVVFRFIGIFKRTEKKIERSKVTEPEMFSEAEKRQLVDKTSETDERKKEQVILKIKKTQEKQRRKYMKSIH